MILIEYILCDESQKKKLSEHAKNCLPNEACAILLGITNGKGIILKEAVMVDNADASPVEFSIKPDQLFRTYAKAEKKFLEIVAGYIHSHPIPSRTKADVADIICHMGIIFGSW